MFFTGENENSWIKREDQIIGVNLNFNSKNYRVKRILIIGATGNVGMVVIRFLFSVLKS
jgi:hypothetical protein